MKKTRKFIVALLLSLWSIFMLFGVTGCIKDSKITIGNITYEYQNNHYVVVDCKSEAVEAIIVSEINGKSVTKIDDSAFFLCGSLISVTIPDTVTTIADSPFNACVKLTNITVAQNNPAYKSIDGNLYNKDGSILIRYAAGKTNLSFKIPDSVTTIEKHAFNNSHRLRYVTIPDSVTTIREDAFFACTRLIMLTIPNSVKFIGFHAFDACDNLTIYCETENKPDGWDMYWNSSRCPVVWGYTEEN